MLYELQAAGTEFRNYWKASMTWESGQCFVCVCVCVCVHVHARVRTCVRAHVHVHPHIYFKET